MPSSSGFSLIFIYLLLKCHSIYLVKQLIAISGKDLGKLMKLFSERETKLSFFFCLKVSRHMQFHCKFTHWLGMLLRFLYDSSVFQKMYLISLVFVDVIVMTLIYHGNSFCCSFFILHPIFSPCFLYSWVFFLCIFYTSFLPFLCSFSFDGLGTEFVC